MPYLSRVISKLDYSSVRRFPFEDKYGLNEGVLRNIYKRSADRKQNRKAFFLRPAADKLLPPDDKNLILSEIS
jgi:hypothetical protein